MASGSCMEVGSLTQQARLPEIRKKIASHNSATAGGNVGLMGIIAKEVHGKPLLRSPPVHGNM